MAKPATILVKMVSTADTGFFYVKKKNPRNTTEKFEMRKYDPVARKHVAFKETLVHVNKETRTRDYSSEEEYEKILEECRAILAACDKAALMRSAQKEAKKDAKREKELKLAKAGAVPVS